MGGDKRRRRTKAIYSIIYLFENSQLQRIPTKKKLKKTKGDAEKQKEKKKENEKKWEGEEGVHSTPADACE